MIVSSNPISRSVMVIIANQKFVQNILDGLEGLPDFHHLFIPLLLGVTEDGVSTVIASVEVEDNAPVIVVFRVDNLHTLDIPRAEDVFNTVFFFYIDSFHGLLNLLFKFTGLFQHLGEAEEIVAEVETVDVEPGFTIVVNESPAHFETIVVFLEVLEDLDEKLLVAHNSLSFVF